MNNEQDKTAVLKENIINAVMASCDTADSTIAKVLEAVRYVKLETTEPGVELVDSLKPIISVSMENAVKHGCDISIIVKGILTGAFRSSDSVRQEAHKTIDHLVQLIVKDAINAGADSALLTEAIITGILKIAQEEKLNVDEALSEAGTSAVLATYGLKPEVEHSVRESLSKNYSGHTVQIKEEFLQTQKAQNADKEEKK